MNTGNEKQTCQPSQNLIKRNTNLNQSNKESKKTEEGSGAKEE